MPEASIVRCPACGSENTTKAVDSLLTENPHLPRLPSDLHRHQACGYREVDLREIMPALSALRRARGVV